MAVTVRRATIHDLDALIDLRLSVASEGIWIGAELPLDEAGDRAKMTATIEAGTIEAGTTGDGSAVMFVAVLQDAVLPDPALQEDGVDGRIVGNLVVVNPIGLADIGMNVADGHRGQGIGGALMEAAVAWARAVGAHKMTLQHWPWNDRARALYERFGFVEEGYHRRHYRRKDGSLWDAVTMGLVLDDESPGHDVRAATPPC